MWLSAEISFSGMRRSSVAVLAGPSEEGIDSPGGSRFPRLIPARLVPLIGRGQAALPHVARDHARRYTPPATEPECRAKGPSKRDDALSRPTMASAHRVVARADACRPLDRCIRV